MARVRDKCRLCRRERTKLFLKGGRCFSPKCPIEKKGAVPPGVHGIKSGIKPSGFGIQLREKQKIKRYYGVLEKQFKNYYKEATKSDNKGEELLRLLETRLDNIVYRLKLAPSKSMARQLVRHGHVFVNKKKVMSPSYRAKVGDKVALDRIALGLVVVEEWMGRKDIKVPSWLKAAKGSGEVKKIPSREDMPQDMKEDVVVEFYSR